MYIIEKPKETQGMEHRRLEPSIFFHNIAQFRSLLYPPLVHLNTVKSYIKTRLWENRLRTDPSRVHLDPLK